MMGPPSTARLFATIERMRVSRCILSASSVDPARGFLAYEQCEADIAEAMQAISDGALMALDHSKFATPPKPGTNFVTPLREGATVVTDRPPGAEFAALMRRYGLETPRP